MALRISCRRCTPSAFTPFIHIRYATSTASAATSSRSPRAPAVPSVPGPESSIPTPPSSSTPPAVSSSKPLPPPLPHNAHKSGQAPLAGKLASTLNKLAPSMTTPYLAFGSTKSLYALCASQAPYSLPEVPPGAKRKEIVLRDANGTELGESASLWYPLLGVPPTFTTWSHITILHLFIMTTRLRQFPPKVYPEFRQQLTDHFFADAEARMERVHAVGLSSLRTRYLKGLFEQMRGATAAYESGLLKGDAELAGAVWRNLGMGREDADWEGVAKIVAYIRRTVKGLEGVKDEVFVGGGWEFAPLEDSTGPAEEKTLEGQN